MKKWAELSGCTGSAADIGNGCQGYAASQCPAGVEVILCTKQGGGHEACKRQFDLASAKASHVSVSEKHELDLALVDRATSTSVIARS